MAWAMAAIAVAQMVQAGSAQAAAAKNEARRVKAQNAARIKQMQEQFAMNTQNLYNNNESIKENKMKNDALIEEGKLESQDLFAQAFAGSGVSGKTQDIMAAELQNSVDKAHNQASDIATKETDRQFLGLMRSGDAMKTQIDNMESFDNSATQSNMNMAMLSSGLSSAASGAFSGFGGAKAAATSTSSFQANPNAFNSARSTALR